MDISSAVNSAYSTYQAYSGITKLYKTPLEGMQRAQKTANTAAINMARGEITPKNMINLMGAQYSLKANAVVIRSLDENIGTLLNAYA